jgi:hypothetical protein
LQTLQTLYLSLSLARSPLHCDARGQRWLAAEAALVRDDIAFGVIGSVATLQSRVFLLKHWWLPGAQGCLYVERGLAPSLERKVRRDTCEEQNWCADCVNYPLRLSTLA